MLSLLIFMALFLAVEFLVFCCCCCFFSKIIKLGCGTDRHWIQVIWVHAPCCPIPSPNAMGLHQSHNVHWRDIARILTHHIRKLAAEWFSGLPKTRKRAVMSRKLWQHEGLKKWIYEISPLEGILRRHTILSLHMLFIPPEVLFLLLQRVHLGKQATCLVFILKPKS